MKKENIKKFKDILKKEGYKIELYDGETIEEKIARIEENNEPISDGAPLVYTERSKGVLPEYDIRTDKWDLAIEKMNVVSEAKRNKIKESMVKSPANKQEEQKQEEQKQE